MSHKSTYGNIPYRGDFVFLQSAEHFDDVSNARAMPEWMKNYKIFMNREV
jgi:hypothetical protein